MKEYWNGIKIADIEKISGCGGHYSEEGNREYFVITMKNGEKHTLHYITKDRAREGEKHRIEIKKLYNEYNNVPEMYLLENNASARINGSIIPFGCRVENNLGQYQTFTLKEIDELRKQFKIRDEGWRHLAYIQMLTIENNEITHPKKVPQRYLDQLAYMDYDISVLKYEKE